MVAGGNSSVLAADHARKAAAEFESKGANSQSIQVAAGGGVNVPEAAESSA